MLARSLALFAAAFSCFALSPAAARGAVRIGVPPATAAPEAIVAIPIVATPGSGVTAIEATVAVDARAAEVVALLPVAGGGRMLAPVPTARPGVVRVGFYGQQATAGLAGRLLVRPLRPGLVFVRVAELRAIDSSLAEAATPTRVVVLRVGDGRRAYPAPRIATARPARAAVPGELDGDGDGRLSAADVAEAVYAWQTRRGGLRRVSAVARRVATGRRPRVTRRARFTTPVVVYTVTVAGDEADAAPGDGTCATVAGTCTLRAAIDEANRHRGDDEIRFAIPAVGPQTIRLTSRLPQINSTSGALRIDGYSQAGAVVNTDPVVSNAVPGITLVGWSQLQSDAALYITSPGNVVRGLAFQDIGRGVVLFGPNAHDNEIVGNFFGMTATQVRSTWRGYAGVVMDGAGNNRIGLATPADRNVFQGSFYGIEHISPGADGNISQNNLIGVSPDGTQPWGVYCDGIDFNIGPKGNVVGGFGPFERNVIAATTLCNGIEISHGWNPALPTRQDISLQWQVNENEIVGNSIGLTPHGTYDPAFVVARGYAPAANSSEGNGAGVNVIDVANRNEIRGNYVNAWLNGVNVMAVATDENLIQGNVIGGGPNGVVGFVGSSGVRIRWHSKRNQILSNVFAAYGLHGFPTKQAAIRIEDSDNDFNVIRFNTFASPGRLAIDLAPLGVANPNDVGDIDAGANNQMNTPEIASATRSTVTGTAPARSTVELFRAAGPAGSVGLGGAPVATAQASATGVFTAAVALAAGDVVVATAADDAGNTSELGRAVAVAAGPQTLAVDDFQRTIGIGFGSTANGLAWATTTPASLRVDGAAGRIAVPAGGARQATLPLAATDVDVAVSVSFATIPNAGSVYAYVPVRETPDGSYRAKLRVISGATMFVSFTRVVGGVETQIGSEVPVGVVAPGDVWRVRLGVSGSIPASLRVKAWAVSAAEPTAWTFEVTDDTPQLRGPGSVGLRAYVSSVATNGPIDVGFDDLVVTSG